MQAQSPEGVGDDFVADLLPFAGAADGGDLGARRCQDRHARGFKNLADTEDVGGIADDDDAFEAVGLGNHDDALCGFRRGAALGFGDDRLFWNSVGAEVCPADLAF